MDEILLRRLLGAATLLAVALLFAALLPTPGAPGREDSVVAYDLQTGQRIGTMPLPPVEHPPELKPEDRLVARPAGKAPETASLPPRPTLKVDETLDQGGAWFVQVGSFGSQANARSALQKLFGMGLETVIQPVKVQATTWYRVRVGPYPAEGAALEALARIRKNGYADAKLVRPEADTAKKGN